MSIKGRLGGVEEKIEQAGPARGEERGKPMPPFVTKTERMEIGEST